MKQAFSDSSCVRNIANLEKCDIVTFQLIKKKIWLLFCFVLFFAPVVLRIIKNETMLENFFCKYVDIGINFYFYFLSENKNIKQNCNMWKRIGVEIFYSG